MAEVLIEYDAEFPGPGKQVFHVRACGRQRDDKLWEGWLEFVPSDGGKVIRTGRETTQPNRDDLMYWGGGLTATYMDGALQRAVTPSPALRRKQVESKPAYDGPADR
jgi:hypothetical protein